MYESYWGLQRNPFENNSDPGFYYQSEAHQASLLKLRYLIEQRKGAGLIVGGSGYGKSYLISVLSQQLAEAAGPFVQLVFPQMSSAELLAYLAVELGAEESAVGSDAGGLDRTIRQLQHLLLHFNEHGRHPVIVVDEAHLIEDPQVFQSLRLLLNFQQQNGIALTLILAGQQDLLSRVHRMPQFEDRIGVKCILRPMSYEETLGYVTQRLQFAGATRSLFEPAALDVLFELSGGVPRKVNRLCDLGLLVGYADGSDSVTAAQLEAVSEELTTVVPD